MLVRNVAAVRMPSWGEMGNETKKRRHCEVIGAPRSQGLQGGCQAPRKLNPMLIF